MIRVVSDGLRCNCTLPDPANFAPGAVIQCLDCNKLYWRDTTLWLRRPRWSDDLSW